MIRIGRSEVFGLPHLTLDERLAKVEAITLADVSEIAERTLRGARVLGAVGPFESSDFERYI